MAIAEIQPPARPVAAAAPPSWIRPGRTLLVASTGGHLDQLHRLRPTFAPQLEEVEWVTFDTPQSRHLLAGEVVHHVPFIRPKDFAGTRAGAAAAIRLLRGDRYARVISTGAAVAVPFITTARSLGLASHYIESAARSSGPSLSGALVSHIPGVRLYAQYVAWTAGRWQYRGAVFDAYRPQPGRPQVAGGLGKVVVTFGTQRGYGFRRAAERLAQTLPQVCRADAEILWQTGSTDTSGLGIHSHDLVPTADLEAAVSEADLVVSHSGIGSALLALKYGRCPVLVPRRLAHGEHTDDHQQLIAGDLSRRRLAVQAEADVVGPEHLLTAATMAATTVAEPPAFILQPD